MAHIITVKEEVVATPEAVAAEAAAAPAEPEVIKKGKQETEGKRAPRLPPEKAEKAEKKEKKVDEVGSFVVGRWLVGRRGRANDWCCELEARS